MSVWGTALLTQNDHYMLNITTKGLLVLSLALCATAHAQLHIAFSETEEGNTLVSFSGVVRPSVLGDGYDFEYGVTDEGQSLVFGDDTIIVAMVDGYNGVQAYGFNGVKMVGTTPTHSINATAPAIEWSQYGGGAGFVFRNNSISLYDGSGNRDWIDWDGYSFVVPQSMAEIGLTADSFGSMHFYNGHTFADVITITWSVGSAVPEPAAYAPLFALATLGCSAVRRRNATVKA